jgi:tRNA(Arg) A34 adenosine deaminase TadA
MHRRTLLTGATVLVATTLPGARQSHARVAPAQPDDTRFMQLAIDEAAQAEFPFGAVIVKNGEVLAHGHNRTRADRDPTAHGEMVAIRAFLAAHGPDEFKGTTLYTSGEPCCMCMGAILWCGIGRLVYAASVDQLATKIGQIMLSSEDVASKAPFAPIDITGGVLDAEAMKLFK